MARLFPAVGAATSRRDRSGHGIGSEPDADAGAGDDLPRRADRRPAALLAALIAAYVAVFGSLTWSQQSNFGTFGFDMGIYDQGIWLLSRFEDPFVTVRGLEYFGHHVNPITLLFVPFYWLGAGPHFLYLVETVWMALGAVPLWLLARDRLEQPVDGRWCSPPRTCSTRRCEWINWWHFHPDALIDHPAAVRLLAGDAAALAVVRGRGRGWRCCARRTPPWPCSSCSGCSRLAGAAACRADHRGRRRGLVRPGDQGGDPLGQPRRRAALRVVLSRVRQPAPARSS